MSEEVRQESVDAAIPTDAAPTKPRSIDELTVGMQLQGRVKRIELYGAFVDLGIGTDGLLHISQLGKADVRNVEDVVTAGQTITVYVLKVDKESGRIALSMSRPPAIPWESLHKGDSVTGKVIRLEKFGVFVDIGAERPGMIHVSELANNYVNTPSDVVKVGDEITAQIIKVDRKKRRIDLSLKALETPPEAPKKTVVEEEPDEYVPTAMEVALRRAMEASGEELPEIPAPSRSGKGGRSDRGGKRDRRDRRQQRELEDIFERTLRHHR